MQVFSALLRNVVDQIKGSKAKKMGKSRTVGDNGVLLLLKDVQVVITRATLQELAGAMPNDLSRECPDSLPNDSSRERLDSLKQESVRFLARHGEFSWYHHFKKDPVNAIHEKIELRFQEWKLNSNGRQAKRDQQATLKNRMEKLEELNVPIPDDLNDLKTEAHNIALSCSYPS